ncbi:MAG TPA: ABC transporter ATP-binding protein [Candidatus Hydrogenedentes bacterium]|nr:ABC transporter ATP-binding protein [Candidatus Hydrogenedentota bacterium]
MDCAIVTSGLTKHYGGTVGIADLDLTVRRGEICGFLGPNGAGKTTTIRLLLGMIRPTRGTMEILGMEEPGNHRKLLRRMGYLPGDIGLYQDMTGSQYLHHLLQLRLGNPPETIRKRLGELQRRFEIDFQRKIRTYSKGMRQITGIIQSFMHQPELIIMDEPTSGLDPVMQEQFYALLAEEKNRGATIFLSSHILTEVARVCDRVVMVKEGRLMHTEDVDAYKAHIGKRIVIETAIPPGTFRERMETLDGVSQITVTGNRLQFFFTGDMQALIQIAGQMGITDFLSESPTLDHVFLNLYGDQ